jgi:hypothetical protein
MAEPLETLPEKVTAIERKVDALAVTVDARFDEVTSALGEQRQYTEFAFDHLRGEMLAGFAAMTTNFGRLERKLDQLIDRVIGRDPGP